MVTDSPDNQPLMPSAPGQYITCQQLIDSLGDYLEEALSSPARHELERHLGVCPSCVAYLDSYVKTRHLGQAVLRDEAGAIQLPEELVHRILLARRAAAR